MAEVGTYYITIMPEMSHFTGGVKSALNGEASSDGKTYSKTFIDVVKGSALGAALGGLAQSAGRSIMSGINVGIGRLDTIENFPKVMEALGYKASDASDSIQLIMKRLDGLPTATQDVVTLTQAIADSTGDLKLATNAALGFNDMMLANGASSAEVVQAQGVLNRVLGKGNATVAQWQSLQSVMPAQLAAVARELGGEGMSVEALRDQLNDGTISWNDFLQAIVKLDTEGSGAMASFEEQARANSKGIGTALENVRNRIGAGWADILGAIGREDISGAIDRMSYGVRDAMSRVGEGITYVKGLLEGTSIGENLQKIGDAIGKVAGALWTDADTELVKKMAEALVGLVDGALKWLADHGQLVSVAVGAIAGGLIMLAGASGITTLPATLAGITGGFQALTAAMAANPFVVLATAIGLVVGALITFFTQTETGQAIWQGFCDIMSNLWTGLQEDFNNLVSTIQQNLETASAVWGTFTDNLAQWNENIRQNAEEKWQQISDGIKQKADSVRTNLKLAWDKANNTTNVVWNTIKQNLSNKWNEIKTAVTTKAENTKTSIVNKWRDTQSQFAQWNERMRSDAATKWAAISTAIGDKLTSIKTSASNAWNNMKSTASTVWNGIKGVASTAWNGVLSTIKGIIDRIKGLLSFHWSLPAPSIPHIKLPHFSVGSKKVLGVDIPTIGVEWYAKGGIFDAATLIGVGEAGREAVLPLNRQSYREIANGISKYGGGDVNVTGNTFVIREEADIDRIASALDRKIRRERMAMA